MVSRGRGGHSGTVVQQQVGGSTREGRAFSTRHPWCVCECVCPLELVCVCVYVCVCVRKRSGLVVCVQGACMRSGAGLLCVCVCMRALWVRSVLSVCVRAFWGWCVLCVCVSVSVCACALGLVRAVCVSVCACTRGLVHALCVCVCVCVRSGIGACCVCVCVCMHSGAGACSVYVCLCLCVRALWDWCVLCVCLCVCVCMHSGAGACSVDGREARQPVSITPTLLLVPPSWSPPRGQAPGKPEECGSPSPEPEVPPVPRLLPSPPLFVTLHADWNTAMADWGLAWEAHVYGAGSLFSLLALLSLLGLACLPVRCPAGCTFLAALDLLLLVAGTARAFPLFYDAYGQQERLPAFASLLLHDLPFPCLSSALAVAFLLLSARSRVKLSRTRFRHPGCLASLVLLHFFVAVGAVLAADLLRQFSFLLLVSRGAYALLAALLSLAFLAFYCLGRADTAQSYNLHSSTPPTERLSHCPFANAGDWSRAARTTLLAACFALLSAALQAYTVLHALGYGLPPGFFGPWPWWSLQLGCRLCEVGTGLPLALVGLYPLVCSHEPPCVHSWGTLFRGPVKAPVLPNNFQWAMAQHEKLVTCDTIARSDSEFLPLYALVGSRLSADGATGDCGAHSPGAARASETRLKGGYGSKTSSIISMAMDGDPTADFRPPSPINLRRSIDEALFSEALIPTSLFQPAGEAPASRGLYRTSSCMELETALPQGGDGEASPATSAPDTLLCSPGRWRGSSHCSSSPYGHSLDGSSLVLCPSLEQTTCASSFAYEPKLPQGQGKSSPRRSPPPPGGPYLPLAQPSQESLDSLVLELPAGDTALLQEEFMDVCRQIDTLSVSSDTIDL
uniref:Proline rich transmembrane protein 4 n=1 Tax=Gopherus evgoodei TaxID=1825980 RepID=A0A8C4VJC5_9SAUR